MLADKKILLGICGSIAAYKAAELARLLVKQKAQVKVIMTPCATEFIQPLTFEAITTNKVQLDNNADYMQHIDLARWADIFLIAPASAATLAKLAHGLCDNVLTTTCLAYTKPIFIAPSMNTNMWQHPSTQQNVTLLKNLNYLFMGPDNGEQACGDFGPGRMLEPNAIIQQLQSAQQQSARNLKVLITAGPTQEAIDPIRYLTNHSSGKMGFALANELTNQGAKVTLIHGPTTIDPPIDTTNIKIRTAEQMNTCVMQHINKHDIFIATAAVADYKPKHYQADKIKKTAGSYTLELIKNPDILANVGKLADKPITIGFAAETDSLLYNAQQKLTAKNADMIIANLISEQHNPFNADNNSVYILQPNNEPVLLALDDKKIIAQEIVNLIIKNFTSCPIRS